MLKINLSPFPVLATARLHLRCITSDDAVELYYLRSNKKVLQYLDRAPLTSEKEAGSFIKIILAQLQKNEGILWVITFKDNPGKMIGTIGYWRIVKEHYRAEIGYLLRPDEWGKGIMKEAMCKVTQYAFKQMRLHSIEANINPGNLASAALLESCGFKKEGYFRESFYFNGVFSDAAIYSLVNA